MLAEDAYALRADGVRKTFGRTEALKSASLWAEPGKVTTLLGRNGSGKTTLMKVSVGLLRPDQGTVSFMGVASERPRLARLARGGLMYLPQETLGAPAYKVRDHFRAIGRAFGGSGIDEAIALTSLEPLLDQRVVTLSRGERVRFSVGLALARQPVVLVADEPLVGLAPKDQEDVGKSLRELARRGTAVVTSGHDAQMLMRHSDVIVWSAAGTTHHLGTPADAAVHWQFRREYLGPTFRLEDAPGPR